MSQPGQQPRAETSAGLDFVGRFADAAGRFAGAVTEADLHAPVPTCPGWSTYDLVVHVGNVHAWAATIVETGSSAVTQNDEPRHRRPRAVSEWYAGKAEDLHEVLRTADPGRSCWNFAFGDDGSAGFWQRRQLHETTIHGVDLDAAAGRRTAIAPLLAEDGVDEVLRVFLPRMHHRGHHAVLTAPLTLIASDTGRAWTISPRAVPASSDPVVPEQPRGPVRGAPESAPALTEGPPLVVDRRHPRADTVVGTADMLYRVLWKRSPVSEVVTTGGAGRAEAFLASRLVP